MKKKVMFWLIYALIHAIGWMITSIYALFIIPWEGEIWGLCVMIGVCFGVPLIFGLLCLFIRAIKSE